MIAPTFRHDLFRIADLAEEVARFYGYDNIPTTLPTGEATTGKLSFKLRVEEVARNIAEFCGFSQGMTYSFESPKVFDKLLLDKEMCIRDRCRYCMPDGAKWIPMSEILTYEEIERICREAVRIGITRFKITGGEPLVRKGCADLIRMIRQIPGTEEVTMTTNGVLLGENLEDLLAAGLDAVNISLDTLIPEKYQEITGADELERVRKSIFMAEKSEIRVKINTVLQKGVNDEEWKSLAELAKKKMCIRDRSWISGDQLSR